MMPPSEPVVYVNEERTVLVRVWKSGVVEVSRREVDDPLPVWGKPTRLVREGEPGEADYLIAALTYFAPLTPRVGYFAAAHQRACKWLEGSPMTPNEIRDAVDAWKEES